VRLPRRRRSLRDRTLRAVRNAPAQGRELIASAAQLDLPWARTWTARQTRDLVLRFVLEPLMDLYTRRRTVGRDRLRGLREPVILVANHASHMDTPAILAALPRRLRKRTAVGAASDYFYRNKALATAVSLFFGTVPIDRCGGGLSRRAAGHLHRLLDEGWSLLLYPHGTRKSGGHGRVRRGAAVLAASHNLKIVPIRVSGTRNAMPPGQRWPRRIRGRLVSRRHPVEIAIGEPVSSGGDPTEIAEHLESFFDGSERRDNGRFSRPRELTPAG
jgi:1-acyl-sn-glycerol-3-phosphate acyltransferase